MQLKDRVLGDLPPDSFLRADESDDAAFYSTDRLVSHLDSRALETIENFVDKLLIEDRPVVLDLMASWDSHIPGSVKPERVVGLGLNERELSANDMLDEFVVHDLNQNPDLPFDDATFDAVLCTVSVDYMTQPYRVFSEVARILKAGGVFLVTFSNRYFQEKVVKIWRHATGEQRIGLVENFFEASNAFTKPTVYVSRGHPRPASDKYAPLGVPSDPVLAVYAEKLGGNGSKRPTISSSYGDRPFEKDVVERKRKYIRDTLRCPYCEQTLGKLEVPVTPFTEWSADFLYVCMHDECPYFLFGWDAMADLGSSGSYRFMYEPVLDNCYSIPVMNRMELRPYLITEE